MPKIELDEKHAVLFAVYAEYQKAIPDMTSLTFETLDMDRRVFNIAFVKLQNEGLIDGLVTFPPSTRMEPRAVALDSVMPTRYGLEYVERRLDIMAMGTGKEKLKRLAEKFGKLGWAVLQDLATDILSKFF